MQTTKARARWLKGGNNPMWEVSHGDTSIKVWTDRPHDAAGLLLEEYVLQNQVEARVGIDHCMRISGIGIGSAEHLRRVMASVQVGRLPVM